MPRWGEVTVDVVVAAGSTQEVTLRLVGPLAEPRPTAIAAPTPVATYPRALPYALLGAGAVTLAAGVAIGVVGVSQAEASPTRDGAEADAARTKALVGDVVGGVGIAAMAAGLGVLIFTPRSRRAPRATHLAPFVAGPSGGLLGTF